VGVVGQGQLLVVFLLLQVLRLLAVQQYGVASGDIAGIVYVSAAAGEQPQRHGKQQCQCDGFFHDCLPWHRMTAPWEPRTPAVTRWDQKRSERHTVQDGEHSIWRTPARRRTM